MAESASERSFNWIVRNRDYAAEFQELNVARTPVTNHPLNSTSTASPAPARVVPKSSGTPLMSDPLSAMGSEDPLGASNRTPLSDPLSVLSGGDNYTDTSMAQTLAVGKSAMVLPESDGDLQPWKTRTSTILQKYTTSAAIAVPDFVGDNVPKAATSGATATDRVKSRLEELESSQQREQAVMLQLNQQDYIAHIQSLNKELVQAWHHEERVKALKIVIQCAKCLADVTVPQFYPSMFVCVTEILDTFGELVWERLKRKSVPADPVTGKPSKQLPEDFSYDDVSEEARETAKNWFFKIASVRELLPRLYVELAILRCTRFVGPADLSRVMLRHAAMIRGLGDPLVASYARAYLFRIGLQSGVASNEYLTTALYDCLFASQQWESKPVLDFMNKYRFDMATYLDLYSPALQWMFDVIGRNANAEMLRSVLSQYKRYCGKAVALQHIFAAFSPAMIASHAIECAVLARDADSVSLGRDRLYMALGLRLVAAPPAGRPLEVLNEIWKVVGKLTDVTQYMNVAQIFIEYPLVHLSMREVSVMLSDIFKHVNVDHVYEQVQPQLQSVIHRILSKPDAVEKALAMEPFMGLLDLLQKDPKISVCLAILETFSNGPVTKDPVIINAVFHVARTLHDSLNSTSLQDERREITRLIQKFILKVNYEKDFEAQLNFFVECRQSFTGLDAVQGYLVKQACGLCMQTLQKIKGNHNKRTLAFVKACLAFCYITIPSMNDVFGRLHLFLVAGQVSLHNQLLSQAEAFFKAAITLLPEVPAMLEEDSQVKFTSEALASFVATFASNLIVIPGHPESGPLYLVHGLIKVISAYKWEAGSDGKARSLLCILSMLCAMKQDTLPYHIQKVDSNDILYGAEPAFQEELVNVANGVVDELMSEMKTLGESQDKSMLKRQAMLALDLFNILVANVQLDSKLATLGYQLFQLAKRGGAPAHLLTSSLSATAEGPTTLHKQLAGKLKSAE